MALTRKEQLLQDVVQAHLAPVEGPPVLAEASVLPADINGLRTLLRTMLGQQSVPTGTTWEMSCNRSATRLNLLEQMVAAKFADIMPRLAFAETVLNSTRAAAAANTAATDFLAAKDDLQDAAIRANALDTLALQKQVAADELAIAALQTRATNDEALIAAAQQKATDAQFDANMAKAGATAAAAKADAAASATTAAKAAADAAQATATTAQAGLATLAGRFRTVRVATPGVAIGGTMSLAITWPTPFADDKYNAVAEFEGMSLLGLSAVVTNRTATGCTVTSKNVLGLQLLAGQGTLTVTAIHDQI
jgi:hypothetical protein